MKKLLSVLSCQFSVVFTVVILSSVFCLLSSAQDGYSIKGKIKGWHDTVCYLGNHYGNKQYVKDTTKIDTDGNFVFKGKKKLDGGIYLIVLPNKVYYEILIDKEQNFYAETDTAKMITNMRIKGSDDNTMFYKYLTFISQKGKEKEPLIKRFSKIRDDSLAAVTTKKDSLIILQDKISAIDQDVETYKKNFIKEHPASFLSTIFKAQTDPVVPDTPLLPNGRKDSTFPYRYYKEHYWDNIPLSDDRLLRTPIFHGKLKYYFDKVIMQHPDSIIKESDILIFKTNGNKEMFKYIVWYMTLTYETSSIMGMDAVFVHEVEQYYVTQKAFWVDSIQIQKVVHRGLTLKPLLLEKSAPPIIMQDSTDKNISLYEVKAKYTVLIFWDPDCGHCQKVLPKLKDAYDKTLKSKGVEVFAVDIEDDAAKWKKFIVDKKMNWINTHDKYKQYYLRQLYDIYSTPVIYLLDENKRIKAKRIDVDQLDGFIDHLEKVKEMEKNKQ
ncbi:MAG: thioredoxin-like domain-containing protein [Bacteroidota bacterium]